MAVGLRCSDEKSAIGWPETDYHSTTLSDSRSYLYLPVPTNRAAVMSSDSSWSSGESEEELLKDRRTYYSQVLSSPTGQKPEEILPLHTSPKVKRCSGGKEEKPDGGWGWMVVLGVAISNMTTQSLVSTFGLLFIQRLSELDISTSGASVVLGVQTTILNLSGLIIGPLIKRFSYRKTAAAGALFVVAGLLLTTLADSLPMFIFSYSLFTGLGLGLLNPTTFVAINAYFSSRKGRAVSLSLAGTGIGQMLLPFLIQHLLKEYGFNGTLLVLAGLAMHSFLGSLLYQPVKWHVKSVKTADSEAAIKGVKPETGDSTAANLSRVAPDSEEKPSFSSKLIRAINCELMMDLSFVNLISCLALVYVANTCFSMLLPFFLENSKYSRPRIALCMSVLSGADILGRLIVPIFTDGLKIRSKTVFFMGVALSALARSALVLQKSFEAILLLAFLSGLVRGTLVCNFNLSIAEQVETDKLPSALELHMLFKGVATMSFSPLVGFVRDYSKSYALCVHMLSIFFLALPFFAWFLEFAYARKEAHRLMFL